MFNQYDSADSNVFNASGTLSRMAPTTPGLEYASQDQLATEKAHWLQTHGAG